MVFDSTQKNPKGKFWRLSVKNYKKTPAKHSIRNSISLNFMNLSTALGPILSAETDFHFYFGPDLLILYFPKILVFQKTRPLFKLIFRAMQLQRLKHNILQKNTILHFSIKYKIGTKCCSNCSRAVFMKRFYFFQSKLIIFGVSMHF